MRWTGTSDRPYAGAVSDKPINKPILSTHATEDLPETHAELAELGGLPSEDSPPAMYFATSVFTPDAATLTVWALQLGGDGLRHLRRAWVCTTLWDTADECRMARLWNQSMWVAWMQAAADEQLFNAAQVGHELREVSVVEATDEHSRRVSIMHPEFIEHVEVTAAAQRAGVHRNSLKDLLGKLAKAAHGRGNTELN